MNHTRHEVIHTDCRRASIQLDICDEGFALRFVDCIEHPVDDKQGDDLPLRSGECEAETHQEID